MCSKYVTMMTKGLSTFEKELVTKVSPEPQHRAPRNWRRVEGELAVEGAWRIAQQQPRDCRRWRP